MSKRKKWLWVNLGDVLHTLSGGTPKTNVTEYWEGGNVPWINSGKLKDNVIETPSSFITNEGLMNSSVKILPKNSVVIALTGSTLGKLGLLNLSCGTSQNVTGIYPSKFLKPKFLFYYLIHIRPALLMRATGSAQPHINKNVIDEMKIPLVPPSIQNIIIKKINSAENKIQVISNKLQRIDELKKLAFEGFIYSQNEKYVEMPLSNFCTQRNERVKDEWRNKRLIGVSNTEGIVSLRISKKESFDNYRVVYPGDFIYNPMRVNIGSIAIYKGAEAALTSPDYVVFSANKQISPVFLLMYFKSDLGRAQINMNTRGSVRSRLYFSHLENMKIPFCGERCQRKAEVILSNFEEIITKMNALFQTSQDLKTSIFQEAFKESNYSFQETKDTINLDQLKLEKTDIEKRIETAVKKNRMNMKQKKDQNTSESLESLISTHFKNRRFTFNSLLTVSKMQYEPLKEGIFKLIGNGLDMEFDKKLEKMFLKISPK